MMIYENVTKVEKSFFARRNAAKDLASRQRDFLILMATSTAGGGGGGGGFNAFVVLSSIFISDGTDLTRFE